MFRRVSPNQAIPTAICLIATYVVIFFNGVLAAQAWLDQSASDWFLPAVASGLLILLVLINLTYRLILTDFFDAQLTPLGETVSGPLNLDALDTMLPRNHTRQGWNNLVRAARDRILDKEIDRREVGAVTDPKQAELLRGLRSLPDGIAITDRLGSLVFHNQAWNQLLGHPLEASFAAANLFDCLQLDRFHNGQQATAVITNGTGPFSLKLQFTPLLADGVLLISRLPLDGRVQDSTGFVWQLRDVTQQSMVHQSQEQFLSLATHELRTPITNIRAYAESLLDLDQVSPVEQREFFNVITSESIRLGRLLDDLLNLQQLQAGSMTLRTSNFDVRRMLEEVVAHIRPLVESQGLELLTRIAPNIRPMHADKEKLTACLLNLLGNAVKYTPAGQVRLIAEQLGSMLEIRVEDTGIGIAPENLPLLFDRFYRAADERVQKIEGNGLGLSFAREVVTLHNGQLTVESELNQGSRFTIRLPLPAN